MKLHKWLCFALLCLTFNTLQSHQNTPRYERPPHVEEAVWNEMKPYFLPEGHRIKPLLDKIFSKRVTLNTQTLYAAGFKTPEPQRYTHTVVTKHKKVDGYIFKLYTDDYLKPCDWQEFLFRLRGAQAVKRAIKRHHWEHLFKVPKKWIYPLPANPAPPAHLRRGNFVIVEQDMNLASKKKNLAFYKKKITKEQLRALSILLNEEGLNDCVFPCNVPYCKDKKLAFVDTQVYYHWPLRFQLTRKFLSSKMQVYWDQITTNQPSNPLHY